jgi:hypothetical protein
MNSNIFILLINYLFQLFKNILLDTNLNKQYLNTLSKIKI